MGMLSSRDNPRVRRWSKLARDARLRRKERRALIEGAHLLAAALEHGVKPVALIATQKGLATPEIARLAAKTGLSPILLSDGVFGSVADAETPQGVAAEIEIPASQGAMGDTVFLEGVQDPANVGAILRSAAAFGVRTVVLDRACADPWSPKALRAGMGGHFALRVRQTDALSDDLKAFDGRLVCTVPRDGEPLRAAGLRGRLGWIFGGEGQGVSETAARHAAVKITIPMAAGAESLNVAAAAAVCLYEAFSKPAAKS